MAEGFDLQQRLSLSQKLRDKKTKAAQAVTEEFFRLNPDWLTPDGERRRPLGIEDTASHIDFLQGAIVSGSSTAFADYARWAARALAARGVEPKYLAEKFRQIEKALNENLSDAESHIVSTYIEAGCAACEEPPADSAAEEEKPGELARIQRLFLQAILEGQRRTATTLALKAIRHGHSVMNLYGEVFQESPHQLGRLWEANKISVAEERMATAIIQYVMARTHALFEPSATHLGRMIVTGVEGEMHQIGANMVADALEAQGWDVRFLGANAPHEGILQAVEKHRCNVVGISVTMLFNMPNAVSLIGDLRKRFGRDNLKIIVGGAAFRATPGLAEEIGADGFAPDLKAAIALTCP